MTEPRKPRPKARYKSQDRIAAAKTRVLKKRGLIGARVMPSHTRIGRRASDERYAAKHPDINLKKRQARANARALKTAPVNSPAWFRAVLQDPRCPKDDAGQAAFVTRLAFVRLALDRGADFVMP
jgi:hypothetical protein